MSGESDRTVAGGKPTEPRPEERIRDARDRLDRALCPTGGSMDFATLEQAVLAIESVLRAAYRRHSARMDELRMQWMLAPTGAERDHLAGKLAGYSEAVGDVWSPGKHERAPARSEGRRAPTHKDVVEAERASMSHDSFTIPTE